MILFQVQCVWSFVVETWWTRTAIYGYLPNRDRKEPPFGHVFGHKAVCASLRWCEERLHSTREGGPRRYVRLRAGIGLGIQAPVVPG